MTTISMPFSGAGPLLLFLAKATLLLLAALVATMTLRRSTAGSRHLVWLAALVGVLALPVLSRIPALQFGILPSRFGGFTSVTEVSMTPAVAPVPGVAAVPAVAPVAPVPALAPVAAIATPAPAMAPGFTMTFDSPFDLTYSMLSTLAIIWAFVAVALLGWLVAGALHVRRIVRTARELTTPDWTTPLCEVADRLDLELPPRLVISDRIEMAFACRALSPTIVLPAAAESWTDDRRRAVLFHELAHVKRHDLLGHTLGRIACALYWFHPLVWTAAKNLRAESERACDDLVLSCGARPSEYAQHLLDMVTSVRNHGAPIMALPMARKKEFEGRMLAILDPAIRRAAPGKLHAAGVVASLAVLSLTVAAVSPASATSAPATETPAIAAAEPVTAGVPATPQAEVRMSGEAVSVAPSPSPSATPTPTIEMASGRNAAINAIANAAAKFGASFAPVPQKARQLMEQAQLAQAGDTSKVALLIRVLETDTDASVRKTAAWGLNDAAGDRVRDALVKALKNDADPNVREMAAWALGERGSESAASALADALVKDKSRAVRETSAWALGQLSSTKEVDALESCLTDAEAKVREVCIWAMGQIGVRAAPRGLVTALTDNARSVRLVAAWAMGEIEDKSTAPAIIKAFETETDTEVRSAQLRALALMEVASATVLDVAIKSNDPEMRRRAVAMLAGGGSGVDPWPWPWPQPRPYP